MDNDYYDFSSYNLRPHRATSFIDLLTHEIYNHPGAPDITSQHRDTLEAEAFANDFLVFSPYEEPPQLVTTGSTSTSPSSSTLMTPSKQPVVQQTDEPAAQSPIFVPFDVLAGSMEFVHHECAYTTIPLPLSTPMPQFISLPYSEPVLDASSLYPITENLLSSSPLPRSPTPEVWTSAPKKSKASSRKRRRDTTPDDQEAPPLACERSHRKRRRTWRHVEGLERLPGALDSSTLEKVYFSLNTGSTATGFKLNMERFGLTKDVFVCGERLRTGCSQRGTSDILELGDKELCGMVFLAEQSLRRHLQTALSHMGKRPCRKCGGMYALRKDGYERHVKTCTGPRLIRASGSASHRLE